MSSLLFIGIDKIKESLAAFSNSLCESGISDWIKEQNVFSVRQDIDPIIQFDTDIWDEIAEKQLLKINIC